VTKETDPEVTSALLGAMAAYLSPEGGAMLRRRLELGSCLDHDRGRYNVGALPNLGFGYGERKSLSAGKLAWEEVTARRTAYRQGATSWLPPGAIPDDLAERVRLYEERRGRVAAVGEAGDDADDGDDDLLGVGLASYATLEQAADEAVRHVYRAAPRDWHAVEAAELAALDHYPELVRVQVPGAPELTAPLGWAPGVGPSAGAEETHRKLVADWEGFRVAHPEVGAADVAGWQAFSDAWRRRAILPGELGDRLRAEVRRARRIRAGLVRPEVAEASPGPEGVDPGDADDPGVTPSEAPGPRGLVARVIVAGSFIAAMAAAILAPSSLSHGAPEPTEPPEPAQLPPAPGESPDLAGGDDDRELDDETQDSDATDDRT
jgi:hypothetical protein